jgi:O-antigen/teichoic acid export membrane protein
LQIATLLSGSIIAQAIIFAFMPVITRLYTPSEFGVYSFFFSITMAIGLISSLKYEQAIVLPKEDSDAKALMILSTLIVFATVIVTLFVVLLFYDWFEKIFDGHSYLIWLLPLSVFVLGLQQIFENYSNRVEIYKGMSVSKVVGALGTVSSQIYTRYIMGMNGLILSKIVADFVAVLLLVYIHLKKGTLNLKDVSFSRLNANLKSYSNFPRYQMGSTLINYLSQYLPIFLFPVLFTDAVVGYYALAFRMLMTPTTLMTGAVRNVYYQRASKMYAKGEDIISLFLKTTFGLIKIYLLPFFVIIVFGKEIFSTLFGSQWAEAGAIAQILVLAALFSFINPPTTMTFNILNLQRTQLFLQIIQFILRVIVIYLGYYLFHSYIVAIALYVLVAVGINIYSFFYIHRKLKNGQLST